MIRLYTGKLKNQAFSLTENQKKALDSIVFLYRKYGTVFVSQSKLAEITDLSRQAINAAVAVLHKIGIVNKIYRGVMQTCIYEVSPEVFTKQFIKLHAAIIPTLLWSRDAFLRYIEKCDPERMTQIDIRYIEHKEYSNVSGEAVEFRDFINILPEVRDGDEMVAAQNLASTAEFSRQLHKKQSLHKKWQERYQAMYIDPNGSATLSGKAAHESTVGNTKKQV